jgi:hypothetical protein
MKRFGRNLSLKEGTILWLNNSQLEAQATEKPLFTITTGGLTRPATPSRLKVLIEEKYVESFFFIPFILTLTGKSILVFFV